MGSFNISKNGTYPYEKYLISPDLLNQNLYYFLDNPVPAENIFRFVNNPKNDINSFSDVYSGVNYDYGYCSYTILVTDNLKYLTSYSPGVADTFTWNVSNLRVNNLNIFNYMYIDFNGPHLQNKTTDQSHIFNSYLLYPQKLYLKPVSVTANNDGTFTLVTSSVLINYDATYYDDINAEELAYRYHLNYKNTPRNLLNIKNNTNPISLVYSLSATKKVVSNPLIQFTKTDNPISFKKILESNSKIRNDSGFVKYSSSTTKYSDGTVNTIGQVYPEEIPNTLKTGFRTSFIQDLNPATLNYLQTFQLFQSAVNISIPKESPANAILTTQINLTSTALKYQSTFYLDSNNRPFNQLTGVPGTNLEFSYIADSPVFFNTTMSVLTGVSVNVNLNTPINTSQNPYDTVTWTVPYPIYHYSFINSFQDSNFKTPSDSYNLNFNLSSGIVQSDAGSALIKLCLASEYGSQFLDINTFAPNDSARLVLIDKIVNLTTDTRITSETNNAVPLDYYVPNYIDVSLVKLLSCFYGPNAENYYDLTTSPYIPVNQLGNGFKIIGAAAYDSFTANFRASLSSFDFNDRIDSSCVNTVNITTTALPHNVPIYFNILRENQNLIELDISNINNDNLYPYKNLTNSNISWNFTCNSPLSSNIKIYSINSINGIITYITPNQSVPFDSTTQTIYVSGYGPALTTITLSSQKYNQTYTINTDPRLFDFLSQNNFVIGESPLTAKNNTVNFTLTAGVNVDGIIYNIPDYVPLYWTWTNDLTAYKIDGTQYKSGQVDFAFNLSSINISVTLPTNVNSFTKLTLPFTLTSHYKTETVIAKYSAVVENYPDPSVFNCDFKTLLPLAQSLQFQTFGQQYNLYTNPNYLYTVNAQYTWLNDQIGSAIVADTRSKQNVITRPNTDLNKYVFYTNTDVLPKLKAAYYQWNITDNLGTNFKLSSTNINNISALPYSVRSGATTTYVNLCAISASPVGWSFKHDIVSTTIINTIPENQFYTSPEFIVYPPYTWQTGNSGYLTLIDNTNYTLSIAPTAYDNKKSGTQNFYFSANVVGTEYDYIFGNIPTIYSSNNQIASFEIPYLYNGSPTGLRSVFGLNTKLTAYSNLYPKYPNIKDLSFTSVKSNSSIYVDYYRLTATTVDFSGSTNPTNAFYQSPRVVPYQECTLEVSAVDTAIVFDYHAATQFSASFNPVTSINLDNNIFVGVVQTITPPNTANSPVRLIQSALQGTVTYMISSRHWVEHITVPALNGIYDLFSLYVGDATNPFTVDPYVMNPLILSATSNFNVNIPSSTFGLYNNYNGNTNLWNSVSQTSNLEPKTIYAYTTSVKPDIYLGTYYALTGEPVRIEFQTPELANQNVIDGLTNLVDNIQITSYRINFGDGISEYHNINDVIQHSYSSAGVYILSYDVNYNNGTNENFQLLNSPITIYENWPTFDQSQIRLINETLALPWTLDQIEIQPNEFGDVDIFNTAISRLYDCFDYLKYNCQTINTDSPTLFYGWLGSNSSDLSRGIQWHTVNYNSYYYTEVQNAVSNGTTNFQSLIDSVVTKNYLFFIDNGNIRGFYGYKIPAEIPFHNIKQISQLLVNPVSIDFDEVNNNLYVVDNFKNKVHKLNLSYGITPEINIQLSIGNFGNRGDTNKFNNPNLIRFDKNDQTVFVLDFGNKCIKHYTRDLNWMYTYFTSDFLKQNYDPISFAIHPTTSLVYVLTKNSLIYVFDNKGELINSFELPEVLAEGLSFKNSLIFDQGGNFIYITTNNIIFKYSILGVFISTVNIPNNNNELVYVNSRTSYDQSLIFITSNSLIKCQDIVSLFRIGQGLGNQYWTREQTYAYRDEFTQDIVYNRAFTRFIQNIKSFRNVFDSKFVIVTEPKPYGTVSYFSKLPIYVDSRPVFSSYIENEEIGVGVNEFNIPQVINREISKIYDSLNTLLNYISITNAVTLTGINLGCSEPFCWSWKAMSCYNLTLPVIRICNINPITYSELRSSNASIYSYAPTVTSSDFPNPFSWGLATSNCCNENISPLG